MNDDEYKKYIDDLKKYLMPAEMSNINKLIQKFGTDISDDFVFVILRAYPVFR